MHRSLRRIICSCIVPHEFKSRTVNVTSVVIIFPPRYALRVSCKIDGFLIMNNKTECELYQYSIPLLQVIGVFFFRFRVHLQSSSSSLYGKSIRTHYPFNSQSLLTCSFIQTPYQPSSHFFALFMFHSPSFNLCIWALHSYLLPISSDLQSTCASCLPIPHSFFLFTMSQFIFLVLSL